MYAIIVQHISASEGHVYGKSMSFLCFCLIYFLHDKIQTHMIENCKKYVSTFVCIYLYQLILCFFFSDRSLRFLLHMFVAFSSIKMLLMILKKDLKQ